MESKYKKLLEDYFNQNNEITKEDVIIKSYYDMEETVIVNVEWEDEEGTNESRLFVTLFDLLAFVYSKL